MSTNSLNLARPNTLATKDCRESIIYNSTIRLSNISNSTLRSDLLALNENLRAIDQAINSSTRKIIEVLDPKEINEALSDLEGIDDKETLRAYEVDLKQIITKRKDDITRIRTEIQTPTFNFKTMSLTSNKNKLSELNATNSNLQNISKREKNEDYYDVLLKQKYVLDEAIKLFEGQSFFDKISPIIDQTGKIINESVNSPATFKKTLIQEGVSIVRTLLKLADSQIKYENMVTARRDIIMKISERDQRANNIDLEIKACFEETIKLQEFEQLRDTKSEYIQEVEKIIMSFSSFIDMVFSAPPTNPKDIAQRFIANAPQLRSYSEKIFLEWLRV